MSSPVNGGLCLRAIGEDDWPLWRKLRLEALGEASYAFSSRLVDWQGDGDTERRWRARLSTVPLNLVANLNLMPAGMASGTTPDPSGSVDLISMWVAPFARGRGVGESLIGAVVEWARSQNAARITLAVVESNLHAVDLYRRFGFVDAGPINCRGCSVASERQMTFELKSC